MAARGHVVHRPLLLLLLLFTAPADQDFKRAWRSWSIRWRSMRRCFFHQLLKATALEPCEQRSCCKFTKNQKLLSVLAYLLIRICSCLSFDYNYYLYPLIFWLLSLAAYLLIRIKQSTILDISFSCKASIKNCYCVGKVRMK